LDHISTSQNSSLENRESMCELRLSPQCNWRNCDFGSWRGV